MKNFVRCFVILLALLQAPVQAKGPEEGPFILHQAYESLYKGENYEIFHPNYVWDRIEPLCPRSLRFSVAVVFDVPNDFQLDEDYLIRTLLREGPLKKMAEEMCPASTSLGASIYFKDKPLGYHFEIKQPAEIKKEGREKAFARMSMLLRGVDNKLLGERAFDYASVTNNMRLKESFSFNDVIIYNNDGLKTKEQIAADKAKAAEQQYWQDRLVRDEAARAAWFEAEKAASNWPGEDNWMMDVYMKGGQSTKAAPSRSIAQNRAYTSPNSWFAIAAYVELSHKRCGTATPNGAQPISVTIEDEHGIELNSGVIHADSLLAGPYMAFRNNNGAYDMLNLAGLAKIQKGYEPLFARWSCGAPEHARFIRGLAKWDHETD